MANLKTEHFGYQEEQLYVFRETFTGNGVATTFQLTGNVGNATFETGEWLVSNVETAMAADVSRTTRAALYDSVLPLVRNKISVSSISATGLVTLDYAPMAENFYVWYWYDLEGDALEDYYRDDYVSSMEADAGVTIASGITTDTAAFDDRLGATEDTVQKALDVLDDYQETFSHVDMDAANLIGTPTYTTLHDWFNNLQSPGRVTGGVISDAGSSTVNVAAGTGYIRASDDDTADLKSFNWAATNGVAIAATSHKYIAVEYNSGSPQVAVYSTCAEFDFDTNFPLGSVVSESINGVETLYVMSNPWWVGDPITNIMERLLADSGLVVRDKFYGGLAISSTGTRCLAVTAGKLWTLLTEHDIAALDTNVSGTFDYYWYKAGTGWQSSAATQLSNTQWNDVTQTTLQALSSGRFVNAWVYAGASSLKIKVLYGQAQYSTIAQAQAQQAPSTLPVNLQNYGILLGRIILKQGTDTIQQVDSAFAYTFTLTASADHGNLAGLGDDDHTQYALAGASRAGTISVEATSVINQDVTTDASPTFASAYLGAASPAGPGTLVIYGVGSGAPGNANIQMYIGEDHDGTYDYYYIGVDADDLFIGVNSDQDRLKLTAEGDLYVTAGTVSCSDLTDGYVPYHVSDAVGLNNSVIFQSTTSVLIGTATSSSFMTAGLLINQAGNDDAILEFQSSDVAHGFTGVASTSTYGQFGKITAAEGGLNILGYGEGDAVGMQLWGCIGNADPADTTPALVLTGAKLSAASKGALAAAEMVLQVRNYTTGLVSILGNGSVGINTSTVPHGGVGYAGIAIELPSVGRGVQFTVSADDYPVLTIIPYSHDSVYITFDAYSDGSNWYSSDVGSNYYIGKQSDALYIRGATGNAAGNTVVWRELISFLTDGRVGIGVLTPACPLEVEDNATTASLLVKITQDNTDVFGLVIGNDTYSTTDTNGLKFWVGNTGIAFIDVTTGDLHYGNGGAGIDYKLTFDGETNDGIITWMEDEDYFTFSDDVNLATGERLLVVGNSPVLPADDAMELFWSFDEGSGAATYFVYDVSHNARHGTITGNPTWTDGISGYCMNFDGSGDYVLKSSGVTLTGDLTYSCWFKATAWPQSDFSSLMSNWWYSAPASYGWGFGFRTATTLYIQGGNGGGYFSTSRTVPELTAGVWYHVCVVHASGVFTIYINGVPASTTLTQAINHSGTTDQFVVGRGIVNYDGYYVNGCIDEARVYNRALTEAEVRSLYLNPSGSRGVRTTARRLTGGLSVGADGTVYVGEEDSTVYYSSLVVYGRGTGSVVGGRIYLHLAADHDTTITDYEINSYEDDLFVGPNTDTDALKLTSDKNLYLTDGDLYLQNAGTTYVRAFGDGTYGQINIGIQDTIPGYLLLYSSAAGSAVGGNVYLYLAADHDATIAYYGIRAYEDDLFIGPDTDTDLLKMTAEKDLYYTDGDVYIRNPSDVYARLYVGQATSHPGLVYIYGAATGSSTGGAIFLYTPDDHDGTIDYYQILAYQDTLRIGPDTDTDALNLTAAKDLHITAGTVSCYDLTDGYVPYHVSDAAGFANSIIQVNSTTFTVGTGAAGVDYIIKVDGETNDGTITWMEDEAHFILSHDILVRQVEGAANANVYVGVNDTIYGQFQAYGHATGSAQGGTFVSYLAADYDTTIDYYMLQAYEDDLLIGPNTDTDALKLNSAKDLYLTDGDLYAQVGGTSFFQVFSALNAGWPDQMKLGRDDTNYARLEIYGHGAGSTAGGEVRIYCAADYDASVDAYIMCVSEDDLHIGPTSDDDALKLTSAKDLYLTAGSLVLPVSEYVNFGGTQGSTGYGLRDNAGYTQVKHSDYEDTWEDIERTHEIGKAIILTDDFVGAIALGHALGWSNTKSGTASDVSTQAIAGPNTGTVTLITGTDTTGYACIYLNNTIYANVWYTGDAKMEWVAFVGGALSDGTDTYKAWLGTGDVTTGGDFTEGAFFTYSHGESSGNWECVTMGAGETSTDSTVAAVANTWVRFTIIASADNATYKFYINGTLVATHTTNLPSAANGFIAKCVKSAGTTSRWLTVDAFYFRQRVSR